MRSLLIILLAFASFAPLAGCRGRLINSDGDDAAMRPPVEAGTNAGLRPRSSPIRVGDVVLPFELLDQAGRPVSSGELTAARGALVLFLPPDDSPAARPAYEWARQHAPFFRQHRIELLLATPHNVESNAGIARREGLRLAVLSDPASWVARAHGAVARGEQHPRQPHAVALGGNERVQLSERGLPDPALTLFALESLPGQPRDSFFGLP